MQKLNRWFYRSGKPNGIARVLNRISAWMYRWAKAPKMVNTLEVIGRSSGKPIQLPVVVVHLDHHAYLVSMLGDNTSWVKNVRAAGGRAAMLKGGRVEVLLTEIPAGDRAPIIKRYCEIAPGGRSHIPVDKDSPLEAFVDIADQYPVFRINPR